MDQHQFPTWTRAVRSVPSRRDVLRSLAGAGLGLGGLRLSDAVAAKTKKKKGKKRKNKKRNQTPNPPVATPQELPPLVFNRYGCVDVGQPCRGDSTNCCSGICQGAAPAAGQPDTSRCVAHNTSICKASLTICGSGLAPACNLDNLQATCVSTTGNAGFCGNFEPGSNNGGASYYCRDCNRDTDCQAEFGSGAACVIYDGICSQYCSATGGTACMPAGDGAAITSAREVSAAVMEGGD